MGTGRHGGLPMDRIRPVASHDLSARMHEYGEV